MEIEKKLVVLFDKLKIAFGDAKFSDIEFEQFISIFGRCLKESNLYIQNYIKAKSEGGQNE